MARRKADPQRFLLSRIRVDADTGCWHWTGNLNPAGYGRCNPSWIGRTVKAHRLAYEVFVGPIPAGMTIDHLCFVRDCVNPEHLEPCTNAENVRRAVVARPPREPEPRREPDPFCRYGHPYVVRANGLRWCHQCAFKRRSRLI